MSTLGDEGTSWPQRLAIVVGGMLGGAARLGLSELLNDQSDVPWGTLTANLVGALALGYVLTRLVAAHRSSLTIPFFCTGLLGSFTTFSALSLETWELVDGGDLAVATIYGLGSLVAGLMAAGAGIRVAEQRT